MYFLWIADEDKVGNVIGQHTVCGCQSALFLCLGKHDTLFVTLRTCDDLFNKSHCFFSFDI